MGEGGNIGERRSRAGRSGCASMTTAERCGDEVPLSRCTDDGFVSDVFSYVCICGWLCSILKGEEMRIDVDGQHGFVELVDWMTVDPVTKITDAARVSYDKDGVHDPEKDAKLVRRLAKDGHWSPFRHSPITIMVSAPEFVARQWYKHVVGSAYAFVDTGWNEVSQRYSEAVHAYLPEIVHEQSISSKQGSGEAMYDEDAEDVRSAIRHAMHRYDELIDRGVSREEARMVLPLAVYTRFYWTASQQALKHFVSLRSHSTSQSHIRAYAEAVDTICAKHYGEAWEAFQ
jgi:thymidylate synthase (FAD)